MKEVVVAVVEFVKAVVGRLLVLAGVFLLVWLSIHVGDLAIWPFLILRTKALRILLMEARRIRRKERGRCPASLPLFESGTARILSEWSKIQCGGW
jgi:hypothetical protein